MLSILKNAGSGSITYYVGDSFEHIKHLTNCKLICKREFTEFVVWDNVEQIVVGEPHYTFINYPTK